MQIQESPCVPGVTDGVIPLFHAERLSAAVPPVVVPTASTNIELLLGVAKATLWLTHRFSPPRTASHAHMEPDAPTAGATISPRHKCASFGAIALIATGSKPNIPRYVHIELHTGTHLTPPT